MLSTHPSDFKNQTVVLSPLTDNNNKKEFYHMNWTVFRWTKMLQELSTHMHHLFFSYI